jgi:hypothetical protein
MEERSAQCCQPAAWIKTEKAEQLPRLQRSKEGPTPVVNFLRSVDAMAAFNSLKPASIRGYPGLGKVPHEFQKFIPALACQRGVCRSRAGAGDVREYSLQAQGTIPFHCLGFGQNRSLHAEYGYGLTEPESVVNEHLPRVNCGQLPEAFRREVTQWG